MASGFSGRVSLADDCLTVTGPVALRGEVAPPGDKSISHRALLMAALAEGESRISNLGTGEDVRATAGLVSALGVELEWHSQTEVSVAGSGPEGMSESRRVIDCANSATTMRLGAGLLAGLPYLSVLTGDSSLRRRPMERVARPLSLMGAAVSTSPGGVAPMVVRGGRLRGIHYVLPVSSAQVKGAVLLAGLSAAGETVVEERSATREHTETMLSVLGAKVSIEHGAVAVSASRLAAFDARVPTDISSAAFFLLGAAMIPGSEVQAESVCLSPTRRAFMEKAGEMGARMGWEETASSLGQPYGKAWAAFQGRLQAFELSEAELPPLVDEVVILAAAACVAEGTTRIRGARELRTKETDRISTLAAELRKTGARIDEFEDGMDIRGLGRPPAPADYDSHGDHRIAMAASILACAAEGRSTVRGISAAAVSYPGFVSDLRRLAGADAA